MRERRQYWLHRDGEERELKLSALTMDCPFCAEPLGSAAGGIGFDARCMCGAGVVRWSEPGSIPSRPGLMASAYREIRERLGARIVGHDRLLDRLALLGARHLHHGGLQRALIIGPSGTGKTTSAVALADALESPMAVWDVSVSAEVGWSGVDAGNVFSELYHACDRNVERMRTAILVFDECDKLAVGDATGTAKEHRRGQAKSLLGILSGGVPVRFPEDGDRGRTISVPTDDMLVLGLGTFEGLPRDPGPLELIQYGFATEFASRWPVILSLDALTENELVAIFKRELSATVNAAAEFGYDVHVPEAVLSSVAQALTAAGPGATPRAGVGWLRAAVDTALLRLLDLNARAGASYGVRFEDVPIPESILNCVGTPNRMSR